MYRLICLFDRNATPFQSEQQRMPKRSNGRMAPQIPVFPFLLVPPSNLFQPFCFSGDEPDRGTSTVKGKHKADPEEMEFSDKERLATVTVVEDFDPVNPTSTSYLGAQVDSDEEQQSRYRMRRPVQHAEVRTIVRALRPPKPKFTYETKAARKYEKKKQAARRNEKTRQAKGRQKSGKRQ